jgi:uncharacterized LabA/DUF88 family protein
MMRDAFHDECDTFVVVSGDADLVPAVSAIKVEFPAKKIAVYIPSRDPRRGAAVEIRTAADAARQLPLNVLKAAQFPGSFSDGLGGTITKPAEW